MLIAMFMLSFKTVNVFFWIVVALVATAGLSQLPYEFKHPGAFAKWSLLLWFKTAAGLMWLPWKLVHYAEGQKTLWACAIVVVLAGTLSLWLLTVRDKADYHVPRLWTDGAFFWCRLPVFWICAPLIWLGVLLTYWWGRLVLRRNKWCSCAFYCRQYLIYYQNRIAGRRRQRPVHDQVFA